MSVVTRATEPMVLEPEATVGASFRKRNGGDIRLSICIPTYNRADYIGETLESILTNVKDDLEVVIVDGASTDNTHVVVESFKAHFPNLIYHRGSRNFGVDRDMATAVELASGKYCWLMSSDDLVAVDAIPKIFSEISTGDDIYLCNISFCDVTMRPIKHSIFLSPARLSNQFDISDRNELQSYLRLATSNNALFCYMSSIIFRRGRWMSVGYNPDFEGTGYAHVFTLFSFIKRGHCILKYIPEALVLNRPGNDSFSSKGLEKRYLMDFDGYLLLGDSLFRHDVELRYCFLNVMTREHPWYRLAKLRSEISSGERWLEICRKLQEFGYSWWQIALGSTIGRYRFVVRVAIYLNDMFPRSAVLWWLKRIG